MADSSTPSKSRGRGRGRGVHGERSIPPSPQGDKAKWDDNIHRVFVDLCLVQIRLGRREGGNLTLEAWKQVRVSFNERTGHNYTPKQLRNHWEAIKRQWKDYRALMRGETGLGWNEAEGKIDMDQTWWDRKVQMCERFSYFRNKDVRLFRDVYDGLFGDVSATGERAWAPSSGPPPTAPEPYWPEMYHVEEEQTGDSYNPSPHPVPADGGETFVQPSPPSGLTGRRMSYEGSASKAKKSKTTANATFKDDIHSIAEYLSGKGTGTASSRAVVPESTVVQSLDILAALPGMTIGSPLHLFGVTYLLKPDAREAFLHLGNDEVRLKWLEYVRTNP